MLSATGLSVGYRSGALLRDTCFRLERGEVAGLIAPNGYGKTTLMRALAGRRGVVLAGVVSADGRAVRAEAASTAEVLYIPGDASMLHPCLSPREHLRIVRDAWGSKRGVEEVAEELAMGSFLRRPCRRLSQGMRQLASLAIGRMAATPYLLLDEPFNALDPGKSALALKVIRRMARGGSGVLVSSHILGQLDRLCDRVLLIRDGALREPEPGADRRACELLYEEYYGEGADAETI